MYEDALKQAFASKSSKEKTSIDKVLGKDDVQELRELIRKEKWDRKDMLDVLNLVCSSEAKLFNYGDWERYVMLKYFAWIREFVRLAEMDYDYEEYCKKESEAVPPRMIISPKSKELHNKNRALIHHNIKFLIDLYLNISRTSLSLGGMGFLELLKNKIEMQYAQNNGMSTPLGGQANV